MHRPGAARHLFLHRLADGHASRGGACLPMILRAFSSHARAYERVRELTVKLTASGCLIDCRFAPAGQLAECDGLRFDDRSLGQMLTSTSADSRRSDSAPWPTGSPLGAQIEILS